MSEEEKPTYSAREIVLELFPATNERLVPRTSAYRLERGTDGSLLIQDRQQRVLRRLTPVASSGNQTTQLCCDLCGWTSSRYYLQLLRVEVPGSEGRRFRYLTACRDTDGCELRRLDDESLRALLGRA